MQLTQIGQPATLTVLQLIEQIAEKQSAEIEDLRQAALARHAAQNERRLAASRTIRTRQSTTKVSADDCAA